MRFLARWVPGSAPLVALHLVAGLLAAESIAPALAGPKKPFEPQVLPFRDEGVASITALDRPGQGTGMLAAALASTDEVVLIRTGRGAPAVGNHYAVGDQPIALIAGDLNGDRRDDLVVLNFWSTDLSVLIARPGGGFAAERRLALPSGTNPDDLQSGATSPMSLADFDSDGCLDLTLVIRQGIDLFRGDCRGGLRPASRIVTDYFHHAIVSADFDQDGHADLAACRTSDEVVVFLGHGDGTFTALPGVTAGILSQGLATGDLDGDGLPDLVTANQFAGDQQEPDGDVSVLVGVGGGYFRPAVHYRAGRSTYALALGDFDRDGDLDIAAGNYNSSDASTFTANGDGTFAGERRVHVGPDPHKILAIDHDRDGALDLVASLFGEGVGFVSGRGDGTFNAPGSVSEPIAPESAAVADLDGDGHQDLIVGGRHPVVEDEDVAILRGLGGGRFAPAIAFDMKPWGDTPGVGAADFNEDGLGDIVVLDSFAFGVALGRPGWNFAPTLWTPTALVPMALAIADFDRDGHLDLALAHPYGDGLAIYLGRGDGGFRPGVTLAGDYLHLIVAGDLDGDGAPDLIGGGIRPEPVNNWREAMFVWKGDGLGSFDAPLLFDLPDTPLGVGFGDIDGDRRPDLVALNRSEVFPLRNLGGFSFEAGDSTPIDGYGSATDLIVADVTNDGLADAVALRSEREIVTVFEGSRDGRLHESSSTVAGLRPQAMVAADFDGDGSLDLATADEGEPDAWVGMFSGVSLLMNQSKAPARATAVDAPAPLRSIPPRRPR